MNIDIEPLFESFYFPNSKVCLRCGREQATSLLYTPIGMRPVWPLCKKCAVDWNVYGYNSLKINPRLLIWNLIKFKLLHPFSKPSIFDIYNDIRNLLRWTRKIQAFKE